MTLLTLIVRMEVALKWLNTERRRHKCHYRHSVVFDGLGQVGSPEKTMVARSLGDSSTARCIFETFALMAMECDRNLRRIVVKSE